MSIISSLANNFTAAGKLKAAGFNNASLANVTALDSSVALGNLILLSTQTASASANISFTTGIDSTYDEYIFKFINCHPASDAQYFTYNFSTDGGSNYNVTKTTTFFHPYHNESDTDTGLFYDTGSDLAQSTSDQRSGGQVGADADQAVSGYLHLFQPSSTTYVKHFISSTNLAERNDYSSNSRTAGYCNTTSAVNAVQFKFSGANIDDGIIKMYGLVKS